MTFAPTAPLRPSLPRLLCDQHELQPASSRPQIAYVLDEHLRGLLWRAVQMHNAGGLAVMDVTRVGDPPDLPLGSLDPDILLWTERENRIVVTHDGSSMPGHLADHLAAGHRSPGVFIVRRRAKRSDVVFTLALYAHASDPRQWQDRVEWIP